MTDEGAGQLNEPNIIEECLEKALSTRGESGFISLGIASAIDVLRRRGLINDLGIEILKRDGVIPPSFDSTNSIKIS